MQTKKPTVLVILDGWGIAPPSRGNAITLAKTPVIDHFFDIYPSITLGATGKDVGLEDHKMSGSEAGHMNIGAGRIIKQDSAYISDSIRDGSFFVQPSLIGAIKHVNDFRSNLHLMGLMSNSDSPHADPEHFRAVLKLAKKNGIQEVFCHLFTDGRDSYPKSAPDHLVHFKKIIQEEGIGKIASLSGRFYAMDRAKNWKRLALAYETIVFGKGEKANSPEEAIENSYKKNITDEYLVPTVIMEEGRPVADLENNDAIIFFNMRSDRARQFTKLFAAMNKKSIMQDDMPALDRPKNIYFAAMTDFGPDLDIHTAFPWHNVTATLPMALGGVKQLYTSETEKFAHVTYFLNGGYADPVGGEDRIMIESQKVDSYVKIPGMSADVITKNVITYIKNNIYDFITINYPNADMLGHTGDIPATVKAVEILDKQIKMLAKEVLKREGNLIITADHGNADDMIDFKTEQPNTFHSKNPVPFILVSEKFKNRKLKKGILANIAPTILEVMGIEKPKAMKEESLLG